MDEIKKLREQIETRDRVINEQMGHCEMLEMAINKAHQILERLSYHDSPEHIKHELTRAAGILRSVK